VTVTLPDRRRDAARLSVALAARAYDPAGRHCSTSPHRADVRAPTTRVRRNSTSATVHRIARAGPTGNARREPLRHAPFPATSCRPRLAGLGSEHADCQGGAAGGTPSASGRDGADRVIARGNRCSTSAVYGGDVAVPTGVSVAVEIDLCLSLRRAQRSTASVTLGRRQMCRRGLREHEQGIAVAHSPSPVACVRRAVGAGSPPRAECWTRFRSGWSRRTCSRRSWLPRCCRCPPDRRVRVSGERPATGNAPAVDVRTARRSKNHQTLRRSP